MAEMSRASVGQTIPEDASNATGVLFRSHIEITRILRQLAGDGTVLSAEVGELRQLFLTRLLHIDPEGEYLVMAYSQERPANAALLEQTYVVFHASDRVGKRSSAVSSCSLAKTVRGNSG